MNSQKNRRNSTVVGKYVLSRTLGEGTFGKVKYAENTETGEKVAIKVLDKFKIQQQNMGSQIKREIALMKIVKNPYIVQLHEVLASKTKIYIVLELITGGELFDEIIRETKFTEEKTRFYFHQLVQGVQFCHEKGVCHRDLKPENLLLDSQKNLKISDFGLSNLYEGQNNDNSMISSRAALLHTACGTPNYVAPEVLEHEGYDGRRADIWSIGVILYVLAAGCLPFDEPTMPVLFDKIKNAKFKYPPSFSSDLKDLINIILIADPNKRASIKEIQKHPWYTAKDAEKITKCQNIEYKDLRSNMLKLRNVKSDTALVCTPSQLRQKKTFQFRSIRSCILSDMEKVLKEIGCDINDHDVHSKKLKISRMTPRGMIGLTIQVVANSNQDIETVTIRRGKGDILEYHRFLEDLIINKFDKFIDAEKDNFIKEMI